MIARVDHGDDGEVLVRFWPRREPGERMVEFGEVTDAKTGKPLQLRPGDEEQLQAWAEDAWREQALP